MAWLAAFALAVVFGASSIAPVRAAFAYTTATGKDFYKSCGPKNPHADTATCNAYTRALVHSLTASNARVFCPPPGVSAEELNATAFQYMAAHPRQLSQPQNRVIMQAVAKAYPCG